MKIAVTGKGGVGKTTIAATLALLLKDDGYDVIAVDADPDANLAGALGFPPDLAAQIIPLANMRELITERTGAKPGSSGGYFKLNPYVADIPEKYSARHNGVRLLVMGGVKAGGSGCVCPENVMLKSLVTHLLLRSKEVVILDMEAGVEHLGRATAQSVDAFIVVVEPGQRSLSTAKVIRKLAADIGITQIWVVGNKVNTPEEERFIKEQLPGFELLGFVSYDRRVSEADIQGKSLVDTRAPAVEQIRQIKERLLELARPEGA